MEDRIVLDFDSEFDADFINRQVDVRKKKYATQKLYEALNEQI